MIRLIAVIVAFTCLTACSDSPEEEAHSPQWVVLEQAMTALYHKDFNQYLSFVDSTLIEGKKELVMKAVRQKYLDVNPWDSTKVVLSDVKEINDSTADVFFKIYANRLDTVYSVQRMVLHDDNWKIKLF